MRKERFPVGKTKLLWKDSLRCQHFLKLFISLVVTNSQIFFFAFIWNMVFMCIPVCNSESYKYFQKGVCRSLCHSFDFEDIRFVVKVIFFSIKFYEKMYFHGKFITEFYFFFTLTYVPLNEYVSFYRKQFSPPFNKKGKLQVFTLYLLQCLCIE